MGFICRGFLPAMRAVEERPEFNIKPPLGAPVQVFLEVISRSLFHKRILPQDSGSLKSELYLS